ncbi:hypothetical protein FC683_19460, partial [Bacillus cereus]|uniref:adhesive domain-containing protein n=1 Tax=Bacillus cereus TaxID=1396 RepID=UPI0010BDA90F
MRKIALSIMAILVIFSGMNISVAEIQTDHSNPEIKRILPNGKQTKDPGIVTKDEDITLDVSYPESDDKTMIIPIGDVFTFNEEKTKNLMKEKQDVTVSYQKEQKQLTITWNTTNKESAVFSLKAIKAGQAKLKVVGQQEKIQSNTLEITIQDPIPITPKPEDPVVVEEGKQQHSEKEHIEDKAKEETEDSLAVEDEKQ